MTENSPVHSRHSHRGDQRQGNSLSIDSSELIVPALDPGKPGSQGTHELTRITTDVPPDGGYGWVCVVCCACINGHTVWMISDFSPAMFGSASCFYQGWGVNSSYGIFLSYYLTHDTYHGTSDLCFAFVGGLSISTALFIAPLATHLMARLGTRYVLLLGVFFETLSFIGSSFVNEIWQLFLSQGVCFGLGMGFLFSASVGIIPQWFSKKRSLANSIAAAGSGFGGLTYSLGAQAMIDNISLAWAFRTLAIVTFFVNFTCAMLLRDRHQAIGSRVAPFHLPLLKRIEFILLQAWGWFSMFGYVVLIFSLTNYAVSVGLTPTQGSLIGALFNLGQGVGRPAVGLASDRLGRLNVATFLSFISGLFCLVIWIFSKSLGVLIFFAIVSGTVAGTFWATGAPITAEVIGLKDLPAGLSITWVLLAIPCTVSEPIALELRTEHASDIYLHCQLFTGFSYIAAAGCLWLVRGWKVGDLEDVAERKEFGTEYTVKDQRSEKMLEQQQPHSNHDEDQTPSSNKAHKIGGNWRPKDLVRRMNTWKRV